MSVNIRDVARAAGVSVATVSKVMNGYTTVNANTREKVLRIIEETQYQPNAAARSLVGQRSMTLGVFLTTGLSHPFFASVLSGIDEALKEKGYDLIYLAQASSHRDYSIVRHCRTRHVEGVIVFGFQRDERDFEELIGSGIPAVFLDMDIAGPRLAVITSDNVEAMRAAVRHLRELGHERIAFIGGLPESLAGMQRHEGYRLGLRDGGLPYRPEYAADGDFGRASGARAMRGLLALPEPPTAIVCGSDMSAFGALDAAAEAGLSVPGDLSVVGFDDIEAASVVRPALTTVRQDMPSMGRRAVELLDGMIRDADFRPPAREVLPTELIVRGTTGRPAKPGS